MKLLDDEEGTNEPIELHPSKWELECVVHINGWALNMKKLVELATWMAEENARLRTEMEKQSLVRAYNDGKRDQQREQRMPRDAHNGDA